MLLCGSKIMSSALSLLSFNCIATLSVAEQKLLGWLMLQKTLLFPVRTGQCADEESEEVICCPAIPLEIFLQPPAGVAAVGRIKLHRRQQSCPYFWVSENHSCFLKSTCLEIGFWLPSPSRLAFYIYGVFPYDEQQVADQAYPPLSVNWFWIRILVAWGRNQPNTLNFGLLWSLVEPACPFWLNRWGGHIISPILTLWLCKK